MPINLRRNLIFFTGWKIENQNSIKKIPAKREQCCLKKALLPKTFQFEITSEVDLIPCLGAELHCSGLYHFGITAHCTGLLWMFQNCSLLHCLLCLSVWYQCTPGATMARVQLPCQDTLQSIFQCVSQDIGVCIRCTVFWTVMWILHRCNVYRFGISACSGPVLTLPIGCTLISQSVNKTTQMEIHPTKMFCFCCFSNERFKFSACRLFLRLISFLSSHLQTQVGFL